MKRRRIFCIVRHHIFSLDFGVMHKSVYLGLDAHTRTCVLVAMDSSGQLLSTKGFSTSEAALIHHIREISADQKYLALEESSLAGWIAEALRSHVTELVVCDPRQNALISRGGNKNDYEDAHKLCRLLRMGELKPVYHSDESHRVDFRIAVQQYLSFRDDHARIKNQIKAKYQQAGVVRTAGTKIFSKQHRNDYLHQLPSEARQQIIANLYESLDATGALRKKARKTMIKLGQRYEEISQFQRMPGIGVVGAHVFSAFILNPYRFDTKQRLWRYCRLGVSKRSSAGKPLAYNRLDRSGRGPLKALSHQCYVSALRTKEPNEVSRFYEASLRRTGNPLHARLNTQRKVLLVLWTIWKQNVSYQSNLFCPPPTSAATAQIMANP